VLARPCPRPPPPASTEQGAAPAAEDKVEQAPGEQAPGKRKVRSVGPTIYPVR